MKKVSRSRLPSAGDGGVARSDARPASPPGPARGTDWDALGKSLAEQRMEAKSRGSKGGGDKWVKMATAMESALDRLRTFYETLNGLRPIGDGWGDQPMVQLHPAERQALLDEVAAAANILKAGLKAR